MQINCTPQNKFISYRLKMFQHKLKIYRFQPYNQNNLQPHESSLNLQTNSYCTNLNHQTIQNSNIIASSIPPWRPSQRLRKLYTQFQNTILCQFICIPCAFCGKLLYPAKAKWIPYDENYTYPLEVNFQNTNVYTRGEGLARTVCICNSCKNNERRYPCPKLYPIPNVIEIIPIAQRRFLSLYFCIAL